MAQITAPAPAIATVSAPRDFLTVQALRAVAALLVVVFHTFEVWGDRIHPHAPGVDWENGAAGVDIFFVISGFVMVMASRRLAETSNGWLTFLRHRVVRIVPLYWLLTTVKLVAVLALPALAVRTSIDPHFAIGSYLFLPVIDNAGNFRPLIPMGWTLTYEFLFYILFALALAIRTDILRVVVPGLVAVSALALWRQPDWPSWTVLFNTIVLEFIFGVVLAKIVLRGFQLSASAALALFVGGAAAILTLPMESDHMRVVMWGIPAFAFVTGAVYLEPFIAKRLPRWLLTLGDASYSIYLSHGFVVPVIVLLIGKLLPDAFAEEMLAIVVSLIGSALVGWVLYTAVEQPMLRFMRPRTMTRATGAPVIKVA